MKSLNRRVMGLVVVGLLASVFAGWSVLRLDVAQKRYESATQSLMESKKYAQQIAIHAQTPQRVSETEMELTLLAKLVEQAADSAGIERRALDRIWPQPARRVGDTAYQRKATQLVVRGVTLPQAIGFLHGLATAQTPLSIDGARLSTPPGSGPTMQATTGKTPRDPATTSGVGKIPSGGGGGGGGEGWTLEATVSHLLYQPTATAHSVTQGK